MRPAIAESEAARRRFRQNNGCDAILCYGWTIDFEWWSFHVRFIGWLIGLDSVPSTGTKHTDCGPIVERRMLRATFDPVFDVSRPLFKTVRGRPGVGEDGRSHRQEWRRCAVEENSHKWINTFQTFRGTGVNSYWARKTSITVGMSTEIWFGTWEIREYSKAGCSHRRNGLAISELVVRCSRKKNDELFANHNAQ
jgi:hypothetical protein